MFKAPEISYQHTIVGTWGEFITPAGRVAYILTKARLGKTGTDHERRLTSQLRPVREVLDPKTLDFNQLLQRDLDDHRVATELLPYLLTPKPTGPAFFPPIVAVLLPFAGPEPVDHFPVSSDEGEVEFEGAPYLETRFGSACRVQRLSYNKELHPTIKLGRLQWNDEHAKLVVLDGQHRAMALIAVDRTINHTWKNSSGERFKHFYEHRVEALIKEAQKSGNNLNLDQVEVPVTVCWFPDVHAKGTNAHKAARKLFVDVNKEARQPSEARLTLLSDTELLNIFSRRMLNRLREDEPPMPLYAIEYDNPDKEAARPVRWSVLANLALLKYAVQYTVFGPDKHIVNLDGRFGGRLNWNEMNERMRRELRFGDILEKHITDDDREIDRDSIRNDDFPLGLVTALSDEFMSSWGSAILTLLGGLLPYQAHCTALVQLKEGWITDDAMSSLAADALFVGVGMYWTLRSSNNHWRELAQRRREEGQAAPPKPEIVRAWEILETGDGSESKVHDFRLKRALAYTSKTDAETVKDVESFYGIANTHACQLGLFLTFATLCHAAEKRGEDVASFAHRCVSAWNAALVSSVNKSRDRRLVLGRGDISTNRNPLNRTRKMDTPLAVYFRYFWLELLYLPEAAEILASDIDRQAIRDLLWQARKNYIRYLVDEQVKDLKSSHPSWSKRKLEKRAKDIELEAVQKALKWAFYYTDEEWQEYLDQHHASKEALLSEEQEASNQENEHLEDIKEDESQTPEEMLEDVLAEDDE